MGVSLNLEDVINAMGDVGGGACAAADFFAQRSSQGGEALVVDRRIGDENATEAAEEALKKHIEGLQVTGRMTLYADIVGSPYFTLPPNRTYAHADICGELRQFISTVSGLMIEFGILVYVNNKEFLVRITIRHGGGTGINEFYWRLTQAYKA